MLLQKKQCPVETVRLPACRIAAGIRLAGQLAHKGSAITTKAFTDVAIGTTTRKKLACQGPHGNQEIHVYG